jgi:hypothetical protein
MDLSIQNQEEDISYDEVSLKEQADDDVDEQISVIKPSRVMSKFV